MMPKTHTRHKRNSFQKGDLVEYVGRDPLERGIGVVLEEISQTEWYPTWDIEDCDLNENNLSFVRVYWQNLDREETLHKARIRRIADIVVISKNAKNKKG
jgi:hypothetical protein